MNSGSRSGSDRAVTDASTLYCWSFGTTDFDEGRWQLSVEGVVVELERKPLEVLQYLLRHAGEAVTKEELLSTVWADRIVVEAVLTNAVGKLRKALQDEEQRIILTLTKVGYRLDTKVKRRVAEHVPKASRLNVSDTVPRRNNWRLKEALARGGDGEVWLARHDKTGQNRVFKFSLDGHRLSGLKREVTVGRLLEQALGERSDLVRVIDWDFEKAPYFVEFEYGGVSLDRWLDNGGIEALPWDKRLALFAEAVETVAAAHGVGVLHKDLKPANMLVYGEVNDRHLRVADFGSSRVFEPGLLENLGITRLGLTQTQTVSPETGTPLYLAPEVLAGQSPSVKSDIYALGVTLYQILVGDFRRPLTPGWESDIGDPLLRQDIADAANSDLEKRPDSAAQLAERIRTLEERRQKATLESAIRERIAVAEHRAALARARRPWVVAAMLILFVGASSSLFYARRSHDEAKNARAAQLDAEKQAKRAKEAVSDQESVNSFLFNNFVAVSDPFDKNEAKDISLRQAWINAEAKISAQFAKQPELEINIRLKLCTAYGGRGQYAAAKKQCDKAVAVADAHPDIPEKYEWQARLRRSNVLLALGDRQDFDKDMAPVDKAVDQGKLASHPLELQDFYFQMAKRHSNDTAITIPMLRKAYDIALTLEKTNPSRVISTGILLANTLMHAVQNEKALELLESLRGMSTDLLGPRHPSTLIVRQETIYALINLHRFAEAQRELDALSPEIADTWGRDSIYFSAVIGTQAQLWEMQRMHSKALPLMADLYQREKKNHGENSDDALMTAWQYAEVARFVNLGLATQLLNRLDVAIKGLPPADRIEYSTYSGLVRSCVLVSEGQGDKARTLASKLDLNELKKLNAGMRLGRWINLQKASSDQQKACSSSMI